MSSRTVNVAWLAIARRRMAGSAQNSLIVVPRIASSSKRKGCKADAVRGRLFNDCAITSCHHLAARTAEVSFRFWMAHFGGTSSKRTTTKAQVRPCI